MMCISVDLPLPEGPRIATISPSPISKLTSSSARTTLPPSVYVFTSDRATITARVPASLGSTTSAAAAAAAAGLRTEEAHLWTVLPRLIRAPLALRFVALHDHGVALGESVRHFPA